MGWMLFVDGENLTIQSQRIAHAKALEFATGRYWRRDTFLWFPNDRGAFDGMYAERPTVPPLRAHYYTTCVGSDETQASVRDALWRIGFDPHVFKKDKQTGKTKGVDISLATDMLRGAYTGTYETAVLVAGDADYLPLVEEVKRQGRRVVVVFFGPDNGLSPDLRLAADDYRNLDEWLERRWKHYGMLLRKGDVEDGALEQP